MSPKKEDSMVEIMLRKMILHAAKMRSNKAFLAKSFLCEGACLVRLSGKKRDELLYQRPHRSSLPAKSGNSRILERVTQIFDGRRHYGEKFG